MSPPTHPAVSDSWWTPARRRALLVAYWMSMFIGTHWPATMAGMHESHIDKLLHFSAFAGLAWLAAWATDATRQITMRHLVGIALVMAIYAAVDEWLQMYVGRVCDPLDWIADMVGTTAGLGWFAWRRSIRFWRDS